MRKESRLIKGKNKLKNIHIIFTVFLNPSSGLACLYLHFMLSPYSLLGSKCFLHSGAILA